MAYKGGFVTNPSVADFKAYFVRDFPYGTDASIAVLDSDIQRAIDEMAIEINPSFFGVQSEYTIGALLLSAHNLVMNLRSSSQGLAGQFSWLQSSRGVGSVSESISIPQRILDNPIFAMLSKTNYGAKYLSIILPQLSGVIYAICGRTQA